MSSTSALECHEDLDNVTLVRMEDVQPDRSSEIYILSTPSNVNSVLDHDYSCVFDVADSNIGSMVSVHSEDIEDTIENNDKCKTSEFSASNPDSWPTLEILPGGVIKHSEKDEISQQQQPEKTKKDMVYACAKCPQTFKLLYNLAKHVRLHEKEAKKVLLNKTKLQEKKIMEEKPKSTKLTLKKKKRKNQKMQTAKDI